MRKIWKSTLQAKRLLTIVLLTIALCGSLAPTLRAQTSSAPSSPSSVIPASDEALRKACAEAVEELKAARKLLASQDKHIELQQELLALEKQISQGLKDLRKLDADEKQALRDAIAAKDRVIAANEKAIAELKKNQWSLWKAVKAGAVGAAIGIVIVTVLQKD